jgi:hypothetical protein
MKDIKVKSITGVVHVPVSPKSVDRQDPLGYGPYASSFTTSSYTNKYIKPTLSQKLKKKESPL